MQAARSRMLLPMAAEGLMPWLSIQNTEACSQVLVDVAGAVLVVLALQCDRCCYKQPQQSLSSTQECDNPAADASAAECHMPVYC